MRNHFKAELCPSSNLRSLRPVQHLRVAIILTLSVSLVSFAQTVKRAPQVPRGISTEHLALMDAPINTSIARKEMPGAVVLVSHNGRIAWRKAYGSRAVQPKVEPMSIDTIFDVASLTKIVATATSIMILVDRGQVRLNDSVGVYLPELKGNQKALPTVRQLLTHVSGYQPDFDLKEKWWGYDEAMKRLAVEPLRNPPGARFVYSDIGFITLGEVVRRVSGQPLDEFARKNIFVPLGMTNTGFKPNGELSARIAPTEMLHGAASYLGGDGKAENDRWLRGEVHDPTSFRMAGVAGHAGLFSTADDLALYCRMILNHGTGNGARILSAAAVTEMTRPIVVSDDGATRGLGWDIATAFSGNRGDLFPLGSFGHTGFTGTSIWIDPTSDTFVIFLSNRVHPDGKGDVSAIRGKVATIVAGSITDQREETVREALDSYQSQVAAMILARQSLQGMRTADSRPVRVANAEVLPGIDVLERTAFKDLAGLRIGLVTNHTGRNRDGKPTIDVLNEAQGVKLKALFSPEHGIRGLQDEKVSDSKDEKTGLPIYSLYGERRKPAPEQLKELDAIVFDIQDIGARFYTYTSTLGNVMEAAATAGIPVFVLDRPNPIGGIEIEGPIADSDKLSFTAFHTIPVRHGMTIGELARLFNEQRSIKCDLRVVKMENYSRAMWFDSMGLNWVNPSPNMRSLTEATLYPGIGLLEFTNVSVGRGTDTPFEVIGAPWIDSRKLAAYLNARGISGVRFVPVGFTPKASVFKDEKCGGVNIVITDRSAFRPVTTGVEIAAALFKLYPDKWNVENYSKLLVHADSMRRLKAGETPEQIIASWATGINDFKKAREAFLLYQ